MPSHPRSHSVLWQHGRRWLGQLAARLLPRACLLCEAPCLDQSLCEHCRDALPGRGRLRCPRCALPLSSDPTSPTLPCPQCQQRPLALAATVALADYLPPLDRALVALKFGQQLQLARGMRVHAPGACPPIRTDWLLRVRDTARQSSLPRTRRQKNLRGAFSVPDPDRVAGQRLALVDDVMTTGSTLDEAAQTLLAAGAASVIALVVARTP